MQTDHRPPPAQPQQPPACIGRVRLTAPHTITRDEFPTVAGETSSHFAAPGDATNATGQLLFLQHALLPGRLHQRHFERYQGDRHGGGVHELEPTFLLCDEILAGKGVQGDSD